MTHRPKKQLSGVFLFVLSYGSN